MGNYVPLSEIDFGKKTALKRIVTGTVFFTDGTHESVTTVEYIDAAESDCLPPCHPILNPLSPCC